MVAQAISGWHGYARRVVEQLAVSSPGMARSVVTSSGLGCRDHEMESFVLGPESDIVIEMAASDLISRLQVIYTHVAERLVDRLALVAGDPDTEDLANRISFVVASSHFADA